MTRAAPAPSSLSSASLTTDERRRVQHNLDRIEDRLRDAPEGLHAVNPPADPAALAASPLPPAARLLWSQWDGLELAAGELRLWPLAELAETTDANAAIRAEGRLRPDDVPIGERGNDILVLCADPHAEGADVVLVEEDGERLPHSAGVDLLVLAVLGEIAVLYDEEGEFQESLFKADGQLSRAAERRLLRRHLDLDPDAPLARFRLARSLRRAGELRAAASELRQLLRRAPDFAWGQHERGRVSLGLGDPVDAGQAFLRAAELATDLGLRAYFQAWACLAAEAVEAAASAPVPEDSKPARGRSKPPLERAALAAQVLAHSPEFVRAQEAAVRAALEAEDVTRAEESLRLGLAVVPGHLGLLSLRPAVTELAAHAPPDDEDDEDEDLMDEADKEIAAARAAAAADDDLADRDAPHGAALDLDDEDEDDEPRKPTPARPAPAGKGKAPASRSKAPASRSKAPASRSKAPASRSKAPASRSKAPASRSKAPAKRR
jgi:tetratricopeptide (TPR) repeat protein